MTGLVLSGRLRGRERFSALRAEGRRARSGPVSVTFVPAPVPVGAPTRRDGRARPHTQTHVAFAVGRAVGSAVVRNRVRRRLRSIVAESNIAPGDYLVGARPDAASLSFEELRHRTTLAMQAATAEGPARPGSG